MNNSFVGLANIAGDLRVNIFYNNPAKDTFSETQINESAFGHNMRYKEYHIDFDVYPDNILSIDWETQEPFTHKDYEVFEKEVIRAIQAQCDEKRDILKKDAEDFRIHIYCRCREGIEYGKAQSDYLYRVQDGKIEDDSEIIGESLQGRENDLIKHLCDFFLIDYDKVEEPESEAHFIAQTIRNKTNLEGLYNEIIFSGNEEEIKPLLDEFCSVTKFKADK